MTGLALESSSADRLLFDDLSFCVGEWSLETVVNLLSEREKPEGVAPDLGLGSRVTGSRYEIMPKLGLREWAFGVEGPSIVGGVGERVVASITFGSGIVRRTLRYAAWTMPKYLMSRSRGILSVSSNKRGGGDILHIFGVNPQ